MVLGAVWRTFPGVRLWTDVHGAGHTHETLQACSRDQNEHSALT